VTVRDEVERMSTIRRFMDVIRSDLSWRIPQYRSFIFYLLTCHNFMDAIRYERDHTSFDHFDIRGGVVIYFKSVADAVIMIKDIWLHRVYTRYYDGPTPRIIVDIGANIGLFAMLAKRLWPSSSIHCYEPEPGNFELLRHNVQTSLIIDVLAYNRAAAKRAGKQSLFLSESAGGHSLVMTEGDTKKRIVEVSTIDLQGIISTSGGYIDFIKIDCEGCEWEFLEGNEDLLRKHVGYVAMEYHEIPGKFQADMLALFQRAGFDCWASAPDRWNNGMLYATAHKRRDARRSSGFSEGALSPHSI
jgi:FkbM family methyltransferase